MAASLPGVPPVEAGPLISKSLQEVSHVFLWRVKLPVVLASVVVLAVHPVRMQLPPVIGEKLIDWNHSDNIGGKIGSRLTIYPLLVDLHAAPDSELAVLVGEGDAEGEGSVGDVVVEVVLLPDSDPLHVVHVNFDHHAAHSLLLVNHVLPHL